MIEIGNIAPSFCAANQDDVEICSRDLEGKWIVLYFYPKDSTPGCTTQACDFTAQHLEFDDLDAVILGISPDDTVSHRKFIEKKDLSITLLSDVDKKICEDYGVWQLKKFMGKEYMGVVRSTFIISPNNKIEAIWNQVKVRAKKTINGEKVELLHVDEVKQKLQELQAK